MKLTFCSAAYPPDLDGIGDYTWWLAGATAQEMGSPVSVITRRGKHLPQDGVQVVTPFDPSRLDSVRNLSQAVATEKPDWIIFQYNPFSWGKRGWCPGVPRALREVKKLNPTVRIAVMFHETTVPRWPWRFMIMRRWQRPLFRAVCDLADVAFASSERYVSQIERIGYPGKVVHLPVGSNLAASGLSCGEARRVLGLPTDIPFIGVFGSAHESRLLDWIAEAFRALQSRFTKAKLLYVGPHGNAIADVLGGRENLIDLGVQRADRAGICLSAMDLLLAPFSDGISTRRGSAIAAFQNGVPVATTITKWTDSVFRNNPMHSLLLSDAATAGDFARQTVHWAQFLDVPETVASYRDEMRGFHDQTFAWRVIARGLLGSL